MRSESPSLTEISINFEKDWLGKGLDFGLAWRMAANHSNDDEIEMPPFGSETMLNSLVINTRTIQSSLVYVLVIPYPKQQVCSQELSRFSH